jgi:hypothetical protein
MKFIDCNDLTAADFGPVGGCLWEIYDTSVDGLYLIGITNCPQAYMDAYERTDMEVVNRLEAREQSTPLPRGYKVELRWDEYGKPYRALTKAHAFA